MSFTCIKYSLEHQNRPKSDINELHHFHKYEWKMNSNLNHNKWENSIIRLDALERNALKDVPRDLTGTQQAKAIVWEGQLRPTAF